ncbi:MAG: SEC-C metal-binding domain-containing protein [Pirellulaceae bacterium]
MPQQEVSLLERLCKVQNPRLLEDWGDGYYVAACRVSLDDVPALIDIAGRWGDWEWSEMELGSEVAPNTADLLPATAWRTLADLKPEAAVAPLIKILRGLEDGFDDWVSEELPLLFGKIGEAAVPALIHLAKDAGERESIRSLAARGLRSVAKHHPHARDRVVAGLTEMMAQAKQDDVHFNTALLVELVEMPAVEAAEAIERAFAGDLLDVGMMGDWEVVRKRLGIEGLGLQMPNSPFNSLEKLRKQMGIGIFSDQPLYDFVDGEIDPKAEQAYYERAWNTFSNSREAQQVIDRHGDLGWHRPLLEFGIQYLGKTVDQLTIGSVQEFLLEHVPRKVSAAADVAASIVYELALFWEYLDRVYQLSEAKAIAAWLKTDGLVSRLEAELSDDSKFGMAKSLFMMGREAGYDMTSQAGLDEFMMAYNESIRSKQPRRAAQPPSPSPSPVPAPVARTQRVGRNDPCPCGSGKKFKKCCR